MLACSINEKSVEEFSTFVKKNVPTAGNMREEVLSIEAILQAFLQAGHFRILTEINW